MYLQCHQGRRESHSRIVAGVVREVLREGSFTARIWLLSTEHGQLRPPRFRAAAWAEDPHTPAEECPEEAEPMTPAEDAAPAPPSATAPEESAWESWESLREDEEDAEDEDGSYVRGGSRGELEVLDVNFCGRARRRLARHARRARIPLVSRALVVEEEFVDVDIVTNEVHDAEPDRTLHMEVSSDEAEANVSHVSFPQQSPAQMPRGQRRPVTSAAMSINSGREVRLAPRSKRKAKAKPRPALSAASTASTASGSSARRGQDSFDTLPTSSTERLESDGWGAAGFPSACSLLLPLPFVSRLWLWRTMD